VEPREVDMAVNNILARNRSMRRAAALLQLQPLPIRSKSGLWYKTFGNFKILQARPVIMENQLKRPRSNNDDGDDNYRPNGTSSNAAADGRGKRPRL
jgi:hypothetical protein